MTTTDSLLGQQTPDIINQSTTREAGARFSSLFNGYILGIRFHKPATETGSHRGKLWVSSTQVRLVDQQFQNETSSGWQEQLLTTPIYIQANTSYVVSVNVNTVQNRGTDGGITTTNLVYVTGNSLSSGTIHLFPISGSTQRAFVDVIFSRNLVGNLTIIGNHVQAQHLVAVLSDSNGLPVNILYQWLSSLDGINYSNISGANTISLYLAKNLVNHYIKVSATYIDNQGNNEQIISQATAQITGINTPGNLILTGIPVQGQILTGLIVDIDEVLLNTVVYQWQLSTNNGETWENILNATENTLALTESFVGKQIRLQAAYTDLFGTQETLQSQSTSLVLNVNDSGSIGITYLVDINGSPVQGSTLIATVVDPDGLEDVIITYQWLISEYLSNYSYIIGETSNTLVVTNSMVGKQIQVIAFYEDNMGGQNNVISNPTPVVINLNDPGVITINGIAIQGQTLICVVEDIDGLDDDAINYEWQVTENNGIDWQPIEDATSQSLILTNALVNKKVRATASYIDNYGSSETLISEPTDSVVNINESGIIFVSGEAIEGETLTATVIDPDGVYLESIEYQWQFTINNGITWSSVTGATNETLILINSLAGKKIRVTASYVDNYGSEETIISDPTNAVTANSQQLRVNINGNLLLGETLTTVIVPFVTTGETSYQWLFKNNNTWQVLNGESGDTLFLTKFLVNKQIRVVVDYFDEFGIEHHLISAPTTPVVNINSPGTITINGTLMVGETLTTTLEDEDGLTNAEISYLWLATIDEVEWSNIVGATSSSLVLTTDLIGKKIKVIASYQDDLGTEEVVTSSISDVIIPAPNPGIVFITGIVRQYNTLTAVIEDINGIEEDSIVYQWEYSQDRYEWIIAPNETESTIYLSQTFFNKFIQVQVTYRTSLGNEVEVYSDPTPLIAEPLSKLSYLGASNPYDLVPVTNAVFTFKPAQDWAIDPDTGNSIPVLSGELILCSATLKQKKDPNLVIQSGVDYNRMYFEGYLSEPNTLVDTQQSKNVTAVINSRIGIFDFVPILESVEEVSLKQREKNGQLVAGYFRFS